MPYIYFIYQYYLCGVSEFSLNEKDFHMGKEQQVNVERQS